MKRFLFICGALAFIALYAITLTTDSNSPLAPYFWHIAIASGVIAIAMALVTLYYIINVIRDKRNHVFGSQIALRLSLMFTLVAVLPALFLFGVSAQFISHSIDSWFGNDTQQALERSLKLSKSALETAADATVKQTEPIRADIATALAQQYAADDALQTNHAKNFSHLALWQSGSLKPVAERNPQQLRQPDLDADLVKKIIKEKIVRSNESLNDVLYTSGWISLPRYNGKHYVLFFRQPVPEEIANDVVLIESARAKYAELMYAQKGLQKFFLITLMIATILAILLALSAALSFARRFVEPILALADGARYVAQNDFSHRIPENNKDELGRLSGLFNHMTEQLAIAKIADEKHRLAQDAARHYLERVLASLSAGVITLDAKGSLKTYNTSAENMLDIRLGKHIGLHHHNWAKLSPQHAAAAELLEQLCTTENTGETIEVAYIAQDESRILLGKAVRLPSENGNGLVLVFDNITTLVRAQKEAAWGEVAKRLAHEIRNPLTPIQLSAERLAWKLHGKLSVSDEQILTKSTDTIVKQVAALKEMVEAFRNYARAPSLKLIEVDLKSIIEEVLILYETSPCTFRADLGNMPLLLKADTTALRQVLHNLFKNAAEAAISDTRQPETHVSVQKENDTICLIVANNGKSFSPQMLQTAFEPYITDKPSGTGLGLAVVKKIVEEHGGRITLANQENGGARVVVYFPSIQ
ncbi:sensor histidine kinase [Wielerella bovis]|uniref:sensor histidine kinase n=1 Tax=Wielerella bovis TaxID=2917790 RepID=UPI002019F8A0|nr:PAS domain-containing sensor histidine kinase [Wielerella bovis]MCG7656702.1 PAS domain-containing sensor histidine kinase [Wielerella bovis]MCG7658925.1 PAS domain-containing sensor histidine kinase [Wielerella bovis]